MSEYQEKDSVKAVTDKKLEVRNWGGVRCKDSIEYFIIFFVFTPV